MSRRDVDGSAPAPHDDDAVGAVKDIMKDIMDVVDYRDDRHR
jgi:hypothetical protein